MSVRGTTTILVGTLLAVPAVGRASPAVTSYPTARTISSESAGAGAPTHATKGIVKLIDDHTLVITRSPQRSHELSFVLDRSTLRSGEITVGSMVEVRYRTQADKRVATAVRAEHPAQPRSEVDKRVRQDVEEGRCGRSLMCPPGRLSVKAGITPPRLSHGTFDEFSFVLSAVPAPARLEA